MIWCIDSNGTVWAERVFWWIAQAAGWVHAATLPMHAASGRACPATWGSLNYHDAALGTVNQTYMAWVNQTYVYDIDCMGGWPSLTMATAPSFRLDTELS